MYGTNRESDNAALAARDHVSALLKGGLNFHRTGRLTGAEVTYRQILAIDKEEPRRALQKIDLRNSRSSKSDGQRGIVLITLKQLDLSPA